MAVVTVAAADACAVDDHTGVEGNHVLGGSEERVDIELDDLRVVGDQVGEAHQDLDQSINVNGRTPAIAAQQWPRPQRLQHAPGETLIEWRQRNGAVLEDLGRHTTEASENDGAEHRIALGADDHLDAIAGPRHALHGDALDVGIGAPLVC